MNKYLILFTPLLCLSVRASTLQDNQQFDLGHNFEINAVNYEQTYRAIESCSKSMEGGTIFSPLPQTLHELIKRNDDAQNQHKILHAKLLLAILTANRQMCMEIINQMKGLGIGIVYEVNSSLKTNYFKLYAYGAGKVSQSEHFVDTYMSFESL